MVIVKMTANTKKDTQSYHLDWALRKCNTETYNRILGEYPGKAPYDFSWYYNYSRFGEYFVNKLARENEAVIDDNIKDIWEERIVPALKKILPTYEDAAEVLRNIMFKDQGKFHKLKETPEYILYFVFDRFNGQTNFSELRGMKYKTFFKLYLYALGREILSTKELKKIGEDVYG